MTLATCMTRAVAGAIGRQAGASTHIAAAVESAVRRVRALEGPLDRSPDLPVDWLGAMRATSAWKHAATAL
jgi:hypothetical protein